MKGMFDTNTSSNSKSSLVSSLRNTKKKLLPPGTKIASPVAALTTSLTIDDDVENESDYGGGGGHDTYKELDERPSAGANAVRSNKHQQSKTPLSATTSTVSAASALTRMVHLARRVGAQSALTKRRWGTLMEAAKTSSFLRTHRRGEPGTVWWSNFDRWDPMWGYSCKVQRQPPADIFLTESLPPKTPCKHHVHGRHGHGSAVTNR